MRFPQAAVRIAAAAVLLIGALTMGLVNLFFTDEFFDMLDVSTVFSNGLSGIISSQGDPQSIAAGFTVFIIVSLVFCLFLKLASKEHTNAAGVIKTAVWLSVIALGLRCAALLAWNMEPVSDFKTNYELSELLTTIPIGYWGRFLHELGTEYTGVWSAHMPFILYQAIVIKAGISPGLLNAFYGTAACIFTALIAKELFGNKAFATALMFASFNPLAVLYTSVLSNQHPGVMLMAASIWIIIKYRNLAGAAIGAAVLGAAQIIRPEMYPAAVGIIIFYIISRIKGDKYAGRRAVVFAAVFIAAIIVCDICMRGGGLISGHIYSGNLGYKLCIGLNKATHGGWSEADAALLHTPELLSETLKERITQPGNLFLLFRKVIYQFGSYSYHWIMNTAEYPLFSHIICRRAVSAYMIIIASVAAIRLIKDKENKLFPIAIILFGYMAAYSLIEIQPRYNFIILPLLTAAAADIQMAQSKPRKKKAERSR